MTYRLKGKREPAKPAFMLKMTYDGFKPKLPDFKRKIDNTFIRKIAEPGKNGLY
jgi:hypothetical protein